MPHLRLFFEARGDAFVVVVLESHLELAGSVRRCGVDGGGVAGRVSENAVAAVFAAVSRRDFKGWFSFEAQRTSSGSSMN